MPKGMGVSIPLPPRCADAFFPVDNNTLTPKSQNIGELRSTDSLETPNLRAAQEISSDHGDTVMTLSPRAYASCVTLLAVAATSLISPSQLVASPPPPRNVIIIVCDGLRAGSVNPTDAPTLFALEHRGVTFLDSHALYPTVTTPNASAIATGHYLGDTGDLGNVLFTGTPAFDTGNFGNKPGSFTQPLENDLILTDIDDHFGGNYLTEETLLAFAQAHGYSTAAVGKLGPTLIQDAGEAQISHATQQVPPPATIVIDDSTGRPTGMPLSAEAIDLLTKAGLPLVAPDRTNGAPPLSQQSNASPGTNETPGTLAANVVQQQYFADATTKAILPAFASSGKPFAIVFWSRDPDGTQHFEGDSLGKLVPGINGPTSRAAIRNADTNAAQILNAVQALGLSATTDIIVTADHGFNTISKGQLDATGTMTRSYAASFTYKDIAGRQDVDSGNLPVGFVAIDIAHDLQLPLFDPDSALTEAGLRTSKPVDPTIPQTTAAISQHPAAGDGLIGGTGAISHATDAFVVVAQNGGSDLIYLPDQPKSRTLPFGGRIALARHIVDFLTRQDYVSGIFVDDRLGEIPGALPLSSVNLFGSTKLPKPAIIVNFRSFSTDSADPLRNGVLISDTLYQVGQGMHGSFDRSDTFNFMAAEGPDFKAGFSDSAPVSNADIQRTLAHVLGFEIPSVGKLTGRVIGEVLNNYHGKTPSWKHGKLVSKPAANGERTELHYQQLDTTRYFDAAGFLGRTNGL
jgi:hypothetical protein